MPADSATHHPVTRFIRAAGRALAWCVQVALILVVVAWLTGQIVTDRYAWSQWLFWLPTPVALVSTIIGMIAVIGRRPARRRRLRIAWLIACVGTGTYAAVVEHALHRPRAADTTALAGLEVMHWNMMQPDLSDPQPFRDAVLHDDADVLILTDAWAVRSSQEVRRQIEGQGRIIATHGPFTIITDRAIRTVHWRMARDQSYAIRLTLDADDILGRPLHILLIDLPSDPRIARAELAADVRAALDARPDVETDLIVGDFNTTRGGFALQHMFPDVRHAFDDAGRGYVATYPRAVPLYHIDHVLLGSAIRCTQYVIDDPGISRHRIQRVWIEPRASQQ